MLKPFHGYSPPNYQPSKPASDPIPPHLLKRAGDAGGTHISPDGDFTYCQRYGEWYRAKLAWGEYGAWAPCERPEGVREL